VGEWPGTGLKINVTLQRQRHGSTGPMLWQLPLSLLELQGVMEELQGHPTISPSTFMFLHPSTTRKGLGQSGWGQWASPNGHFSATIFLPPACSSSLFLNTAFSKFFAFIEGSLLPLNVLLPELHTQITSFHSNIPGHLSPPKSPTLSLLLNLKPHIVVTPKYCTLKMLSIITKLWDPLERINALYLLVHRKYPINACLNSSPFYFLPPTNYSYLGYRSSIWRIIYIFQLPIPPKSHPWGV
jgi:hypothetical protein